MTWGHYCSIPEHVRRAVRSAAERRIGGGYLWPPLQFPFGIMLDLTRRTRPAAAKDTLVVLTDKARLREVDIERADRQYLLEQLKEGNGPAICDISGRLVMVHQVEKGTVPPQLEAARRAGAKMAARLNLARRKEAQLLGLCDDGEAVLALAEGWPWPTTSSASTGRTTSRPTRFPS